MTTDGSGSIADYLVARGQLPLPSVTRLAGGVSGETFLVETVPARVVVKRALDKLLVERDWRAKPERAMTEAAAIAFLHRLTPQYTPALLDADADRHTIVMTAAPAEWVPWKSALLGDVLDPTAGPVDIAAALGEILGTWHAATWADPTTAAQFDDHEAFEQLRISPFHRVIADAHPDAAPVIRECISELESRHECLVHGDFSPKNVLVGADGLMVLDFEVAHTGAAIFDLGFMCCHLGLKAMHMPSRAPALARAATAFVDAYAARVPQAIDEEFPARLARHTACLWLARVDGLSPASYLASSTAAAVRELALSVLVAGDGAADMWDFVTAAAGRLAR